MNDRAGAFLRARKARDRALVLVAFGLILLLPPIAGIFHVETKIFSIPATLIYVFVVWAALIAAAAFISRPLQRADEVKEGDE